MVRDEGQVGGIEHAVVIVVLVYLGDGGVEGGEGADRCAGRATHLDGDARFVTGTFEGTVHRAALVDDLDRRQTHLHVGTLHGVADPRGVRGV